MRTTVDIHRHLLERLRDVAHEQGVPFKEVLNSAIRRGIEAPRVATEPYRCPSFAMGAPLHGLDKALDLAASLEEEEIARKLALRK